MLLVYFQGWIESVRYVSLRQIEVGQVDGLFWDNADSSQLTIDSFLMFIIDFLVPAMIIIALRNTPDRFRSANPQQALLFASFYCTDIFLFL